MPRSRSRKTKWGDESSKIFVPGVPPLLPNNLTPLEFKALLMRIRIDEITAKITSNNIEVDTSDERSPSPPPQYDNFGKRTNTREQRTKEVLALERQQLIQEVQRFYPQFIPPNDYRPVVIKKKKKIPIPIDKYPDYNFIGLIIGPRGLTQKQMERESGAKIAIRGKGSVKDGRGRMDGKQTVGFDEPLHVLITGDDDASVKKAEEMVRKLLVPVEEGKNEHKRQQLRKLAEINGTLRDNEEMRPDEFLFTDSRGGGIRCANCGEFSHPTRDCPIKDSGGDRLDTEVMSFFQELGAKKAEFSYEELDTFEFREAYNELMEIFRSPMRPFPHTDYRGGQAPLPPSYPAHPPVPSQPPPPSGSGSAYGPPMGARPPPPPDRRIGNPSPYGPQGWR